MADSVEVTPVVEQQTTEEESAPKETPVVAEEAPVEEPESDDEEIEYTCPPEFNEREEMRKMFVGGLDKDTADEEFRELFSAHGEVTDFIIIRKDNSKSDRLFGFITFACCDDLEDCLLARPHKYKEKELDVKRAVPRGAEDLTGHFKVKKLHVANVPQGFTSAELKKYLRSRHPKKYGKVEEINLLKQKDEEGNLTDKNRGFGFIMVSSEDFADRIAIGESKFTLNGNAMRISKAKPRTSDGAVRGGRGNFRGKSQGYGHQGWDDWNSYGGGYNYNSSYGYGQPYSYGGYGANAYDYYGGSYGVGYGPQRSARGGRFQPY